MFTPNQFGTKEQAVEFWSASRNVYKLNIIGDFAPRVWSEYIDNGFDKRGFYERTSQQVEVKVQPRKGARWYIDYIQYNHSDWEKVG